MGYCAKKDDLYICEDAEVYEFETCLFGEAEYHEDGSFKCAFQAKRQTDGIIVCTCAKAKINEDKRQELLKHFKYYVMNSWNEITSFAKNIKVYNVIPQEYRDAAYNLIETSQFYNWYLNPIMEDYEADINKISSKMGIETVVGVNGRSGGYLVMSFRKHGRLYHDVAKIVEDFEENEEIDTLYEMVKLFDECAKKLIAKTIYCCQTLEVVEEEILVPKTVTALRHKEVA
jgi:hypothetical protein